MERLMGKGLSYKWAKCKPFRVKCRQFVLRMAPIRHILAKFRKHTPQNVIFVVSSDALQYKLSEPLSIRAVDDDNDDTSSLLREYRIHQYIGMNVIDPTKVFKIEV